MQKAEQACLGRQKGNERESIPESKEERVSCKEGVRTVSDAPKKLVRWGWHTFRIRESILRDGGARAHCSGLRSEWEVGVE